MKKTVLAASLLCAAFSIQAQETIPVSGGNATGSGGTSELFCRSNGLHTPHIGSGGGSSQGVQQSFEIFTLSNSDLKTVTLKASMYPNPTTDYVILALADSKLTGLSYAMYNIQGKIVTKGTVSQKNTEIGMQGLASGTYILKVNKANNELKTFKIIKK